MGSVLMMCAWRLPPVTRCVGVEAQAVSVALARRSLTYNGCESHVAVVEDDFREARALSTAAAVAAALPAGTPAVTTPSTEGTNTCETATMPVLGLADLVTGTPPYFRIGTGYPSSKVAFSRLLTSVAIKHLTFRPPSRSSARHAATRCAVASAATARRRVRSWHLGGASSSARPSSRSPRTQLERLQKRFS